MCGIYCWLRHQTKRIQCEEHQIEDGTFALLKNRGPNDSHQVCFEGERYRIVLAGFVLWQQGENLCRQPLTSSMHSLLLNGDIFTEREIKEQSDTEWLLERIDACANEAELIEFFRYLEGPYSLVFFNRVTETLYFVRDSLGRQSLLLAVDDEGGIYFSSVLAKSRKIKSAIEIPPLGLYAINLKSNSASLHPWTDATQASFRDGLQTVSALLRMDIPLETNISPNWMSALPTLPANDFSFENALGDDTPTKPDEIFQKLLTNRAIDSVSNELIEALRRSIRDRISATPAICRRCLNVIDGPRQCSDAKIGILFSGGIDCTILACLADQLIDPHLPIDLINVSFERIVRNGTNKSSPIDYNTPDRLSALASLDELKRLSPQRQWNLIIVNVTRNELNETLRSKICHLVYPLTSVLDESLGAVLWFGSNAEGFLNDSPYKSSCRVLLIGSGADELFGGYTRHRNAFIRPDPNRTPFENLEHELEFDFQRLPSRNLARDDRVIGDCGVTARSPFLEEQFVQLVRNLRAHQKCYHSLDQGVGDKLLLRLCGYRLGLRDVTALKKRAMQFGSRVADRKQNAKDQADSLRQTPPFCIRPTITSSIQ